MENQINIIKRKLSAFLKKYYSSMLLKGLILFTATGGLYFLLTVGIEYFFWLSPGLRSVLFWIFVTVEVVLFVKFLVIPLLYLLKLKKGLDEKTASRMIGAHFKEVDDKLLNVLQLSQQPEKSELLLASIAQKSDELRHVPFQKAINLKTNVKYLKFLMLPFLVLAVVWISGKSLSFQDSYKRMVDHRTVYTPPAPFEFTILNDSLKAISGVPFVLQVSTLGKLMPESIQIDRNGQMSYMQPNSNGVFEYTLDPRNEEINFYLSANKVRTGPYTISVLPVPSLMDFSMQLNYPAYTGRKDETLDDSGNATVPEGTKITWNVIAENTSKVELMLRDSSIVFTKEEDEFILYHSVYKTIPYELATSNEALKRYERLGFHIQVIKDQHPKISTRYMDEDLSGPTEHRIIGEISDDYGFKKLELVYYREQDPENPTTVLLSNPKGNIDKFQYTFPSDLDLEAGINYLFYFRVTDNDGLRNGKSSKSEVYSYYAMRENELREEQLYQQKEQIDELGKSLERIDAQEERLEEIKSINKQKESLNYNDRRKLDNFISRQKQQEQLMQNFTKKMQNNLDEFQKNNKEEDPFNELLQERLERQQMEIEKNQKLLEELNEYTEKIDKETLTQKLEELAKTQQSNKRSLEQLLELTKRYYVQAKAENIRNELEQQAEQQDSLSQRNTENENREQKELNERFDETIDKLKELEKENQGLQQPMDLSRDQKTEEEIKQEQQQALDKLEKQDSQQSQPNSDANKNQKNASQKVRKLAQNMESAMSMANAQMLNEDAAMLRQILDNLIKFTFDQEEIMEELNAYDQNNPNLPSYLRQQNDLKTLFEHVDDSLFALSLRRPELSEVVNTNITEVYYNIDKSLERFADNQYFQGITHQQYTLTAANNLADFLSDMLESMQNMMMGSGQGSGGGFQLPDIIQSQEELNQKMQEGMSKGKEGEQKEGEGENGKKQGDQQGEQLSEELFEIYKQQQMLRNALEEQLNDLNGTGSKKNAENILRQMENIEQDLLNKGINEQTLRKMASLKHQLLKLEDAEQLQGEKEERESTTNRKEYGQNTSNQLSEPQESFQELEILQRQVLPLREIYKQKVQRYFKGND